MKINFTQKQQEVIDSVLKEKKTHIFLHGAISSGKTIAILYLIDFICLNTPGIRAFIGRKTLEALKLDTFQILERSPGFLEVGDKYGNRKGEWKDGHKRYEYNNGSIIFFGYLEDVERIVGATLGLVYIEQVEQIKEDVYRKLLDRLRQFGGNTLDHQSYINNYNNLIKQNEVLFPRNYFFMTANPENCWLKDEFIDKENKLFKCIHTTILDNWENVSESLKERFESESDYYKEKYFLGSWEFAQGAVYPEFSWENNVPEEDIELKYDLSTLKSFIAIDPGYVKSKTAVLFSVVLPTGELYIFDEIAKNGDKVEDKDKLLPSEISPLIKAKINKWKINPRIFIDFAANAQVGGATSLSDQYRKAGLTILNCRKHDKYNSILSIKNAFKNKKILVAARCLETIKEFQTYRWHPTKPNEVLKENDDFCDGLRYIWNEYPTPYIKEQKELLTKTEIMNAYYKDLFKKEPINSKPDQKGFKYGIDYLPESLKYIKKPN